MPTAFVLCMPVPVTALQGSDRGIADDRPTGSTLIDSSGLVAAYDMNTRTPLGLLRDFGPHENHGEVVATTSVVGVLNHAMRFATAADKVHLPENESFDIDGPLTIAVWLRIDALDIHQHFLACDDKFALWVTPENRIRFSDTLGHGVETSAPVTSGTWFSVVATFTGRRGDEISRSNVRLYLNGAEVATRIVNRTGDQPLRWLPGPLYSADACYIGFESHQGNLAHQTLQFEGAIDEWLIFARPLSHSEIEVFSTLP